jgi:hypothetical protein
VKSGRGGSVQGGEGRGLLVLEKLGAERWSPRAAALLGLAGRNGSGQWVLGGSGEERWR